MEYGNREEREEGKERGEREGKRGNASSIYIPCNTKNTKGKPAGPLKQ